MFIKNKNNVSLALLACLGLSSTAYADPLPGEVLKFEQTPQVSTPLGGAIFFGHDNLSTAYAGVNSQGIAGYQGSFMADDFADKLSSPVVHLSWWGSYINNPNNTPLTQFMVSFESDVPGVPGTFSHPGSPLLSQIVNLGALAPASGTYTEQLVGGSAAEPVYKYNAELNLGQAFPEQKDTVYWLKIVALTSDRSLQWGWHNRDYTTPDPFASPAVSPGETQVGPLPIWHFQDDAVSGLVDISSNTAGPGLNVLQTNMAPTNYIDNRDGPQGIGNFSQDLAFSLYTAPEPASLSLLGVGALLMRRHRRRPI